MHEYKFLFKPIRINNLEIKNRVVFAPMATGGMLNSDGTYTDRVVEYYRVRARGGSGLIVSGVAKVENEVEKIVIGHNGRLLITQLVIPRMSEVAENVHYYDAKFFVQLTAGDGINNPEKNVVSASAVPTFFRKNENARELSINEIVKIIKAFGKAAEILLASGVDGIELNGHEGYLLDNFQSALWNKRRDKYGGDLRNRVTFAKEIVEEIKNKAGSSYPVIYKYGLKHFIKGDYKSALKGEKFKELGRDVDEGIELAVLLEKIGMDALVIDAGCYDSWYWVHPPTYQEHGCLVDFAEMVKKAVKIPVIAIGRLDIPKLAEEVLRDRKADMIAIGRGLLADPDWPNKVKKGEEEDIKPCTGCHEGCLYRDQKEKTMSCAVNPVTGGELYFGLEPVLEKKKILVAGGGVAGMEAAIVSKKRGHDVVLYEKTGELGGHLREASVPDFKKDLARLLDWYKNQIKKLNIKVNMNTEVTPQVIEKEKPDAVIVATGSVNAPYNIPGADDSNIVYATDLLLGKKEVGNNVAVVGGGMVGLETALWLAKKGKKVTIVEKLPEVAVDGVMGSKEMIIDLLGSYDVKIMVNHELAGVIDGKIKLINSINGKSSFIEFIDNLIFSSGLIPENWLYRKLYEDFPCLEIYRAGDCKGARKIMNAIWEGYHISRCI